MGDLTKTRFTMNDEKGPLELVRRYREVKERVLSYASKKGLEKIPRICVVTKTVGVEEIKALYNAGARDFGENRADTFENKLCALKHLKDISWHFIGRLQSKKILPLLSAHEAADLNTPLYIHSAHDLKILQKIEESSFKLRRETEKTVVFLQVNTTGEITKQGLSPKQWLDLCSSLGSVKGVLVDGLMTMGSLQDSKEQTLAAFLRLKELSLELSLKELSMGMSNDFEIAIKAGSTLLRLGSLITSKA